MIFLQGRNGSNEQSRIFDIIVVNCKIMNGKMTILYLIEMWDLYLAALKVIVDINVPLPFEKHSAYMSIQHNNDM